MEKTIKVRIAIAVSPDGVWQAAGWSDMRGEAVDDADSINDAEEGLACTGEACAGVVFVVAEVQVPKPVQVKGTVEA